MNRFGWPVLHTDLHQKWRKAVKQAGLPDRTRFHGLKHLYTTTLGGSGKHDPKTVQALSRHAEFSETWDTYARTPTPTHPSLWRRSPSPCSEPRSHISAPEGSPVAADNTGADATRQQPDAATTNDDPPTDPLDRSRNRTGVLKAVPQ
uniref:tyrosine-type recombinase/integrase n=1 Tax=Streptomyces calvus TaxID=67282 RepID=UPI003517F761